MDVLEVLRETYKEAEKCLNINNYSIKRVSEALILLLQLEQTPRIVNVTSDLGQLKVIFQKKETGRKFGTGTWHKELWYLDREGLDSALMFMAEKAGKDRLRMTVEDTLLLHHRRFVSSRTTEMKSAVRSWADVDIDILLKIFKLLNMIELASVSQVCRSWHAACSNPWLWDTLDLELLKSNFIQTTARPYIWVNIRSDRNLMTLLQLAMALSRGNITILIFHFNLYMNDAHLSYISERCPHLKQLVLPAWNRITKWAICNAIHRWQELESLTMPTVAHPPYVMEAIGRSCKNLSSLKVMGTFDIQFASSIICHLPNLKVLSLRCSILTKDALMFILHCMDHLEVLNISHCMLLENLTPSGRTNIIRELDQSILGKTSRLREFYYCMSQSCTTCQRMTADEGLMRWYRYEEWFWREDEVSSLSLGRDYGKLFDEGCLDLGFRN